MKVFPISNHVKCISTYNIENMPKISHFNLVLGITCFLAQHHTSNDFVYKYLLCQT